MKKKNKLKRLFFRIYNDYFMKSRLKDYEKLIIQLKEHKYNFITISDYKKLNESGKHVIIRHDIDSDVKIARQMVNIEIKYGVKTTYFMRLKTLDSELINAIKDSHSEIGYHFEEIATYIKNNKIKSVDNIDMHEVKKLFEKNLSKIEEENKVKINSIASHGDFINRKYKITNNKLFDDEMQKKYPNIIEAYDSRIEGNIDGRISDDYGPNYWKPETFDELLDKEYRNVLILVHTRYWNKAPIERFKEDFFRIIEGIKSR